MWSSTPDLMLELRFVSVIGHLSPLPTLVVHAIPNFSNLASFGWKSLLQWEPNPKTQLPRPGRKRRNGVLLEKRLQNYEYQP